MWSRTRTQLTIRNAAVLSVILIALGVLVYLFMQQMLFAMVDRSLTNMRDQMSGTAASSRAVVFRLAQMDRPIVQLLWTEDERLISTPVGGEFGEAGIERLRPSRFGTSPQTVEVGGQYFRVLNVDSSHFTAVIGIGAAQYSITKSQLLSNVTAEIVMLRRLFYILLFGGAVGTVAAVIAGYYLANRALIPIRRSMERQQQFVSDASHELRTPLSVIQAHAELMLRHPDHTVEQDSKHVSTVLQEARRMSKLVGDLLTLARSDSNRLELDVRPVQFDRIVHDGVRKMQMLAEVKEIILHSDIDSPVPMRADEERLHQMLVTLLDNAIKYTPEGGLVRVVCRKFAHTAQLEVEDTGAGIAPEHLPRIFDRFYRGDQARTRKEGGTGLGLSIAKWIVERHGGKIHVESKLAVGTRVLVTLPLWQGNGP